MLEKLETVRDDSLAAVEEAKQQLETGAEIDVHLEEKGIKMVVNPFADKSVRKPNMIQNGIAEFFNDLNAVRDDIQKDIQRQSKKVEAISKMVQRKLNL